MDAECGMARSHESVATNQECRMFDYNARQLNCTLSEMTVNFCDIMSAANELPI